MHDFQVGFKFETSSVERRDELLAQLLRMLDSVMRPGDKTAFTIKRELPVGRGKEERKRTLQWECGEPELTLYDFGIYGTQHDMFGEQLRDLSSSNVAQSSATVDQETGEIAVADDEQPAADPETALDELLLDDKGQKAADDAAQQLSSFVDQLDEDRVNRMISDVFEQLDETDSDDDSDETDSDETDD